MHDREQIDNKQNIFKRNRFIFAILIHFQDDLTGQAILDVAFARLNLIETAYFGVRYMDEENQTVC